ncbi:unnamed protein product [Paramecium octaurelia]|uniref:Mini antigen n=1 Tax=Paramecium octaurelia TaxID=43137 RepID=A0A8S1W209_PAROT|nr:unnamed protein product [Paramecium octaurelia]
MIQKQVIYLLVLVILGNTLTVDTTVHCDCSELRSQDCQLSQYCYWNDNYCESYPNKCAIFTTQSKCTPTLTNYLCKWDDNSCVSHFYKCDEFSSSSDCPCYWNLDNECAEFKGCSNYDEENCPASQGCVYKVSECQAEDYVTCSDQTSATCSGKEGMYTGCAVNNDKECDSYSLFAQCSDLNNFKTKCEEFGCKFENNECQLIECKDLSVENCTSVDVDTETKKLCTVQQQKCVEAQDTTNLNIDSCYISTNGNYKWVGSCVQCESLVYSNLLTYISLFLVAYL